MTKDNKSKEDILKNNKVLDEETNEEVQELTKEQQLEQELNETKNDYLRAIADLENYRKRTQEELMQARDRSITNFVQELLPSIDNFEMSLKMTDNKDMFIKGVEMIHQNLLNTLKDHHIEEYEPKVGEEFNLKEHEPILIEDNSAKSGIVLGIVQKGYKKKDQIIRPAKVQIKKEE